MTGPRLEVQPGEGSDANYVNLVFTIGPLEEEAYLARSTARDPDELKDWARDQIAAIRRAYERLFR